MSLMYTLPNGSRMRLNILYRNELDLLFKVKTTVPEAMQIWDRCSSLLSQVQSYMVLGYYVKSPHTQIGCPHCLKDGSVFLCSECRWAQAFTNWARIGKSRRVSCMACIDPAVRFGGVAYGRGTGVCFSDRSAHLIGGRYARVLGKERNCRVGAELRELRQGLGH